MTRNISRSTTSDFEVCKCAKFHSIRKYSAAKYVGPTLRADSDRTNERPWCGWKKIKELLKDF